MAATLTLYAPEEYIRATSEQRAAICNGCGPASLWKFSLISDMLFGLCIKEACDIHDWMYAFGRTEKDREEADRVFRNNMLRIVDWSGGWGPIIFLRRRKAQHYYALVRNFGATYFWADKNAELNEYVVEVDNDMISRI